MLVIILNCAIDICNPALAVARSANRNNIKRPSVIPMIVLFCRISAINARHRFINALKPPITNRKIHGTVCATGYTRRMQSTFNATKMPCSFSIAFPA
jgi:hypothetical protein